MRVPWDECRSVFRRGEAGGRALTDVVWGSGLRRDAIGSGKGCSTSAQLGAMHRGRRHGTAVHRRG